MRTTKIRLAVGAVALVGSGLIIGTALTGGGAIAADGSTDGSGSKPAAGADRGGHEHTAVTGAELTKVTAAVKAHDATITVTEVRKDPDGSYDVLGTKAGERVFLEVRKDLATITERTGGPGGHGGGPGAQGGSQDTPVTGAELTKVTAAVKAHDATITVTEVRKDPDGSYDVLGTKAGERVFLEVSKDLATITERTGGPGGPGGGHGRGPGGERGGADGTPSEDPSSGATATPSSYRIA